MGIGFAFSLIDFSTLNTNVVRSEGFRTKLFKVVVVCWRLDMPVEVKSTPRGLQVSGKLVQSWSILLLSFGAKLVL